MKTQIKPNIKIITNKNKKIFWNTVKFNSNQILKIKFQTVKWETLSYSHLTEFRLSSWRA